MGEMLLMIVGYGYCGIMAVAAVWRLWVLITN